MNSLHGPLLSLSLRHTKRATGWTSIPPPPTNEERLRALRQFWPIPSRNDFNWPQSAANPIGGVK